ncbi:terminase family protein [Paenibacillus sp. p3-SID1389]|uniref:terminase large subunit domain-containing protein n=1 Tax=Paenibacillus sp. p3-SID1389 TaxID=2916364 RepID=UPI0021A92D0C|nr:terminase family protein [Paenibacillus sp. p3-SID1389]MCT2196191.1 terminase family protein [Paenibacillus sp. p3-SID1389]
MALTKRQKIDKIMSSFPLFCKNFIKIVNNDGELVPFVLNDQQQYFIDNAGKYNLILKPRQLGFTTVSLAYCLWMAITNPNTNYLIVSYKGDSAKDLFAKLKRMNQYLPRDKYHVFPRTGKDNRDELVLSNGSTIRSTTTGNKDLGRGMSLMYVLLSEAAFYSDLNEVLLALEPALQKTEKSKIVLESTANGFNHFQQLYDRATKGLSKYKAFFFPFYSTAYEKQFAFDIKEAVNWYRSTNKGQRLSAKDLSPEQKQLHDAGCSLNMLMWREYILQDKDKNQFYQEYPATDIQAFVNTGRSIFDQTRITDAIHYVLPPITKEEILKHESFPDILKQYIGKGLEIYHLPKPKQRMFAGVDVASGSGNDYSTVSVFGADGQQYASFCRNDIPVYKFAEIVRAIGLFFNYAFLVIERNGFGTSVLERLREGEIPYLNLFKHRHFDKGKTRLQLGWSSNAVTKNKAVTDAKEMFECQLVQVNCRETLKQMQTFVDKDGKAENKSRTQHDDLVISLMLAIQGIKANKYYVEVV